MINFQRIKFLGIVFDSDYQDQNWKKLQFTNLWKEWHCCPWLQYTRTFKSFKFSKSHFRSDYCERIETTQNLIFFLLNYELGLLFVFHYFIIRVLESSQVFFLNSKTAVSIVKVCESIEIFSDDSQEGFGFSDN